MFVFEWTLLLLAAAVALAALARRWKMPYPALLAMLGCAIVFMPGAPRIALQPELALALFVAPILLDAAYDTSVRDLRENWLPIAALVLVAVATTTAAVAWVAHALVPSLPWAAAIALGAIVAPPDASAATTVLRSAPLPHRTRQILEGESLLNDATALLTYRVAVAAATGSTLSFGTTAPLLLAVAIGSLVAGAALSWFSLNVLHRVQDVPSAIVLQFVGTFGVWILAERVGLSGILTVVAYAIGIARVAPMRTPARIRLPSYAVWETTVFVLNALAFVLVGLQLGPILDRLSGAERSTYAVVAAAVLATVVVTRIVTVMAMTGMARPKASFVAGWCGMRGIVTLAAAIALPEGFPGRDLILLTAFVVVLGTLVLQGMTLRPLLLWLDLRDEHPVERETQLARAEALKAAVASLDGDDSKPAKILRFEFEQLWSDDAAGSPATAGSAGSSESDLRRLRRSAVAAARRRIDALRRDATIGDDAYHRVERVLDHAEMYAEAHDIGR